MRKAKSALLVVFLGSASLPLFADTEMNLEIVRDAARKLEFGLPENRAYYLVKHETVQSVVALVFGYVDNEAACEELALALSSSHTVGAFVCEQVR